MYLFTLTFSPVIGMISRNSFPSWNLTENTKPPSKSRVSSWTWNTGLSLLERKQEKNSNLNGNYNEKTDDTMLTKNPELPTFQTKSYHSRLGGIWPIHQSDLRTWKFWFVRTKKSLNLLRFIFFCSILLISVFYCFVEKKAPLETGKALAFHFGLKMIT